jgi:uncharacterized membrane protein YbaN (DUF454 family)
MSKKLKKGLLIIAGTISAFIGIIGIFVPILPTTPFLLLAAVCYLRSSQRFYRWLLNSRFFGAYVRSYLEGRGLPLKIKIITILMLWAAIGLSAIFAVEALVIRIVLLIIAAGVTVHIIFIRASTKKRKLEGMMYEE